MVDIKNLLKTTDLPVAYHHYEEPPKPPYIVYLFLDSDNFGADDKVFYKINNYQVELYTTKKDPVSEKLIEDVFDNNDIFYEKTEVYIEGEKLYQVMYQL